MPRIPIYESQLTPTTDRPAPVVSGADFSTPAELVGQIGQTVYTVAHKFAEAQAKQEFIKASLEAKRRIDSILEQAQLADKPEAIDKHKKAMESALYAAEKQIKNRQYRLLFRQKYQPLAQVGIAKLNDIQRRKVIEQGKALSQELDREAVESAIKYDDKTLAHFLNEYKHGKRALVETGVITPDEAKKDIEKTRTAIILAKINQDPIKAYNDFRVGKYDFLKEENPKEFNSLMKQARLAVQEKRKAISEELFNRWLDGDLSFADVAEYAQSGLISDTELNKWRRRFKNFLEEPKQISTEPNPAGFANSVKELVSGGELSLDDLYDSGQLTFKELAELNHFKRQFQALPPENQQSIASFIQQVDNLTTSDEAKANIYKNLIQIAEQNEFNVDKIKQTIDKAELERLKATYPEIESVPDIIATEGKIEKPLKFEPAKDKYQVYFPDFNRTVSISKSADLPGIIALLYQHGRTEKSEKAHAEVAKALGKAKFIGALAKAAWNGAVAKTYGMMYSASEMAVKVSNIFRKEKISAEEPYAPFAPFFPEGIEPSIFVFNPKKIKEVEEQSEKYINDLRNESKGVGKYLVDLSAGMGKFVPDLLATIALGSITKMGFAAAGLLKTGQLMTKAAPISEQIIQKMLTNEFILGTLEKSVYANTLGDDKDRSVLQRIESIAGDLASSYAIVYNMPHLAKPLKNFLARVMAFTGIGVAHDNYQSLVDRQKLLSADEMASSVANNVGMGIIFEGVGLAMNVAKNKVERDKLSKYFDQMQAYIGEGEIDKLQSVIEKVAKDGDISWETKSVIFPEETLTLLGQEKPKSMTALEAKEKLLTPQGRSVLESRIAELENKGLLSAKEMAEYEVLKSFRDRENIPETKAEEAPKAEATPPELPKETVRQTRPTPIVKEANGRIEVENIPKITLEKEKGGNPKWEVPKEVRLAIPIYQGGKRNTIDVVYKAVKEHFPERVRNEITEIRDMFGGSGLYSTALAEALQLPNLKRIVINEYDPFRVAWIKYIIERGDKIYEDVGTQLMPLVEELSKIADSKGESKSSAGRAAREFWEANKNKLSDIQKGLLSLMFAGSTSAYGTAKNAVSSVHKLINEVQNDVINAHNLVKKLKERGVEYVIEQGDAYEKAKNIEGRNVLVVADPPYYMTKGYDGGEVSPEIYRKTAEMLKELRAKGVKTIYNDSAWWLKKDYSSHWREGKEILENLLKEDYNWYVTGKQGNREGEILGVYNGEETVRPTEETGRGVSGNVASNAPEEQIPEGRGNRGGNAEPRETATTLGEGQPEIKQSILKSEKGQIEAPINPQAFYENTLKPAAQTLTESTKEIIEGIRDAFLPENASKEALKSSLEIRKAMAERALRAERFEKASEKRWLFWNSKTPEENIAFMKLIESGEKTGNPKVDKLIDTYRAILDESYELSKALYDKINYVKDYFPHIWENPKKATEFLNNYIRRIGKENFAKERTVDLIEEGLKAGLKLKYDNVEDIVAARYMSALSARMKADMIDRLEQLGFLTKEDKPGLSKIMTPKGVYYGDPEVIRILDRKLQQSIFARRDALGKVARGWLGLKNLLTMMKLGWSGFHAIATTISDLTGQAIVASKKFGRGDIEGGLKELFKVPASPIISMKDAKRLERIYFEGPKTPEEAEFLQAALNAGMRIRMPSYYRAGTMKAIRKAAARGDYLGAGLRLIPKVMEGMSSFILEHYVPKLKVSQFWRTYKDWLEAHPDATEAQKQRYAARLWNSIDNRFGQVVYDNLFWHRIMRDAGIATTLSLGWNLGDIRETGGAITDLIDIAQRLAGKQAEDPVFVDRIAFVALYPIVTGIIGALTHYLMTGKPPKKVEDVYYPQTGGVNPDGSPERILIPSYMKDVFSIKNAIEKYGLGKGIFTVLSHKTAPIISLATDLLRNRDFYGVEIVNPQSPVAQKAIDIGKYILEFSEPISVSSARRMAKEDKLKAVLPFLGLSKAPRYISRTKIQGKIYNLLSKHFRPKISRSEWERKQKERELLDKLRKEKPSEAEAFKIIKKAMDEGVLGEGDTAKRRFKRIMRQYKMRPDVVAFGYLTKEEQKQLWQEMTLKEKITYWPTLHKDLKKELGDKTLLEAIMKEAGYGK